MCYCAVDRPQGRSTFPLGMFALVAAAVAGLSWIGRASNPVGSPAWVPNDSAVLPRVEFVGGVRHVLSSQPAAHLAVDTSSPRERVRLLWLNGRSSQPAAGGSVVLDDDGRVARVDERLRLQRMNLLLEGREIASAASANGGGLWLTTLEGEVLRIGADGHIDGAGTTSPFVHASVASNTSGSQAWLVRSRSRFAYRLDAEAPLLARLGDDQQISYVGAARMPAHRLLTDLANAGSLAVQGDTVYFAPFIRDEVVAMRPNGDTIWVASRGLPQSTTDPRFELDAGRPVVNYHPVNLGIALGPDGNVYVLSTPGFTTLESRVDVFESGTGTLLRSAALPTALPTLAVSPSGRIYLLNGERLLASSPDATRDRMPVLTLPTIDGDKTEALHVQGNVSLVNVWASWCAPCREEMPALDSLQRNLSGTNAFRFVSVNEDIRTADARRFLDEFGLQFPVLSGHGRTKRALHYPGLPYTLLIDGDGRVVRKWIGFTGPSQIDDIRAAIHTQLAELLTANSHAHHRGDTSR